MKPLRKSLVPVDLDGDEWRKQFVEIQLAWNDREVIYSGSALVSVPRATQVIEFEIRTSIFRPAEISIPMLLSSRASVSVFINNELIEVLAVEASREPVPVVRQITISVTKWTEPFETSKLKLLISSDAHQSATTILLGTVKAEMGAEVSQKWSWSYAFQSLLFFALSWSCVVGLAILILAHIQPLGDTFRFYAVLIAVLTWIAGVLGLPDIARLPLRPMLRRLYSKTSPKSDALSLLSRSRRVAWLLSLFLTFILVSSGVGVVIYCLSIRQYYSNLVHRALEETDPDAKKAEISEALSLLPWRKEAQILFESEAYGKRNAENMSGFRNYIKTFATQQDVKLSIGRAPDADHLPLCLTKTASTNFLNDPVVWYASTIVEGEDESETLLSNEAVSMLATRKSPLAELQLWKMKLGQMMVGEPGDENEIATQVRELEIESTANQLRELLLKYNSSRGAQEYQAACDTLAGYFLRKCHLTAVGHGLEEAAYWFKEEISARQNQSTNSGALLWLRPPDKLRLFYMFGSQWNMPGKAANDARCLLDARNCLKDPAKEPEPCDFAETFKRELWVPNWHYQDEPAWTRGTVRDHDLKLNQVIEDSLKKGWRY